MLILMFSGASLVAQMVKDLPAMQETQIPSLGREGPWRRAGPPTPVPSPGNLLDRGAWRAAAHGVARFALC